jgi:hypothetical protein
MENNRKTSQFRDGLLFKAELIEGKDGKILLHCECEDRKSKELFGMDFTTDQIKNQTDHLVDKLEGFLKLLEIGLHGSSSECTLIIVRQENQVILSFSYKTDIFNREFDVSLRKFHRDETERLSNIVHDLQNDMHQLQLKVSAPMNWKKLKLKNGCCIEGKGIHEAPPSYLYRDHTIHIRGYVRFPEVIESRDKGMAIAKLPKEFFPMDYMKVFKQPSPDEIQSTFYRIDIRTNGEIYLHNPVPNGSVFLDGMTLLCTK